MNNLITSNQIEETKTFKSLPGFQQTIVVKRDNRAILEQALIHYNTTGTILPHIGDKNVKILTEIIEKDGKHNST